MSNLRESLTRLLESGGPALTPLDASEIVVYGAGGCGRGVAATAAHHGKRVRAFLDARADGERRDGIPCLPPSAAEVKELAAQGVPAVIGIFNYATDLRPIRELLREIGFNSIASYPEFHEQYGDAPDFWLTKRSFYSGKSAEILAAFDLLADETSRQIFHDVIAHRLTFGAELLAEPDTTNHYLPPDLPPATSPMRLIDGGAFSGDTLALFTQNGVELEAVAAFEPDPANYKQLCAQIAASLPQLGEVIAIPCGVGAATEMCSFRSGGGSGSAIGSGGETNIQVVALDDVLPSFAPTFLKLDIEGSEPLALRGATRLIRQSRPRIAASVYHEPQHLWTIPQLIHEIEPAYRLALRYHQRNGFDVVAYAFES